MSIRITEDNYEMYRRVFEILCANGPVSKLDVPEEMKPMSVLREWEQQFSKPKMRQSLRMGLNDSIAMFRSFPAEFRAVDDALMAEGLPAMAELTGGLQKLVAKVVKAKRLKNDAEYYAIKEVVDGANQDVSSEDLAILTQLADSYRQT